MKRWCSGPTQDSNNFTRPISKDSLLIAITLIYYPSIHGKRDETTIIDILYDILRKIGNIQMMQPFKPSKYYIVKQKDK